MTAKYPVFANLRLRLNNCPEIIYGFAKRKTDFQSDVFRTEWKSILRRIKEIISEQFLKQFFSIVVLVCWQLTTCPFPLNAQQNTQQNTQQSTQTPSESNSLPTGLKQPTTSSSDFQVRQVFVPESDLSVLGDNFIPTDRTKLVDLVNESLRANELRKSQEVPRLSEGTYVARLVGQALISEASRWTIEYAGRVPRIWTVPKTSIAWRPLRTPSNSVGSGEANSNIIKFFHDGTAESLISRSQPIWLGWTARGESANNSSLIRFSLQLPPAVRSRLLIELPPNWTITTYVSIASRIDDVNRLIPKDWPTEYSRTYGSGNWWVVHIPVDGRADFAIGKTSESRTLPFQDTIARQLIEHHLTDHGLKVSSKTFVEMTTDKPDPSSPRNAAAEAILDVDSRLGISDVLVNGSSTPWTSGETKNTIIVNLESARESDDDPLSQIEVFAVAAWPLASTDSALPTIRWRNRYVLDGSHAVRIDDVWTANSLRIALTEPLVSPMPSTEPNLDRIDFAWQGTPPDVFLASSATIVSPLIDIVSRFTNSNDGFVATIRVKLPVSERRSDMIEVEMDSGWVIDSVQTLDGSATTAQVLSSAEVPGSEGAGSLYTISINPSIDIDFVSLEINARKITNPETIRVVPYSFANENNLHLDSCKPIRFRGFNQSDTYLIEATGRYTIEATPSLIESRIEESELPLAYRSMLPRLGEFWLIKPPSGQIPRLLFRRQAAPYTVEIETFVQPTSTPGIIETRYHLHCLPVAGAVNNLVVSFPNPGLANLKWFVRSNATTAGGVWLPIEMRQIESQNVGDKGQAVDFEKNSNNESSEHFHLALPRPTSIAFELEAVQQTNIADPIALLLTPEAAQVRTKLSLATTLLCVEESVSSNNSSGFRPQDLWDDSTGMRFRRFQYDPTRELRVRFQQEEELQQCWIGDMRTIQHVAIDGNREAEVTLNLYQNTDSELCLGIADGWTIRNVLGNDARPLQIVASNSMPYPWTILLPRSYSANDHAKSLKFMLDGPAIPMRQGSSITWPSLVTDCKVLHEAFEVVLPPGTSVDSNRTFIFSWKDWLNVISDLDQSDLENRFSFRRWIYQNVFGCISTNDQFFNQQITSDAAGRLQLHRNQSVWQWIAVIGSLLAIIWMTRNSWHVWWIIFGLLLLSLAIVPDSIVNFIQSMMIAEVLSLVFFFCYSISPKEAKSEIISQSNGNRNGTKSKKAAVLSSVFLVMTVVLPSVFGQVFGQDLTVDRDGNATHSDEFYSIIFPIDAEGNLSGDVAYVAEDFFKRLNRKQTARLNPNYLVSARHEVFLDSPIDSTNRSSSCTVTSLYEWNIEDLEDVVRIPIAADTKSVISVTVEGVNQMVNTNTQANSTIDWLPSKLGRIELRLTYRYGIAIDASDALSVRLPIIPIANTTVDVLGTDIVELKTNALGQVTNPNIGRFTIAIGSQNDISLQWRQSAPKLILKTGKADVDIEWAAFRDHSIAKCNVVITGPSSDQNGIEIECEAPWEPVGFDWGDAKVNEVVSGSTNLKKRYRVRWKSDVDQSRKDLHFFLRNMLANDDALVSLPSLEFSDLRIDSRTITIGQSVSSRWTINHGNTWTPSDSISKFDWLSTNLQRGRTLKTQDISATISLQRTIEPSPPTASIKSFILFGDGVANGSSEILLDRLENVSMDLKFLSSPSTKVQAIKLGSENVRFIGSTLDNGQTLIQAFIDSSKMESKVLQIEYKQEFKSDEQWQALPLVSILDVDITSNIVSASGLLDLPIEFDGIGENLAEHTPPSTAATLKGAANGDKTRTSDATPVLSVALPFSLFQRDANQKMQQDAYKEKSGVYSNLWKADLTSSFAANRSKEMQSEIFSKFRYRVISATNDLQGFVVSALSVEDATWTCRLFGSVSRSDALPSGLLFDIPVGVIPSENVKNRLSQFDSPEAGRRLLLVSPNSDDELISQSERKRFNFSIDFIFGAEQSALGISVPTIRLLNGPIVDQWIAVPKSSSHQDFVWTTSGVRAPQVSPELREENPLKQEDFLWFAPISPLPEVRLNNLDSLTSEPRVDCTLHRLSHQPYGSTKLESYFVLDPQGIPEVTLSVPPQALLLGVSVNDEFCPIANSSHTKDVAGSIVVRLQSSVLPQFIKATFELPNSQLETGQLENDESITNLELPSLKSLASGSVFIESNGGANTELIETEENLWSELPNEDLRHQVLDAMVKCSDRLGDNAIETKANQRNLWWGAWQAFSRGLLFPADQQTQTRAVDAWLVARERLVAKWRFEKLALKGPVDGPLSYSTSFSPAPKSYVCSRSASTPDPATASTIDQNPLRIQLISKNLKLRTRLQESLLCLCMGALIILVSSFEMFRKNMRRFTEGYTQYFVDRPWRFIAGMGVVLFLLFPISWAGPGLLVMSLVLVLRQYFFQMRTISNRLVAATK